MRLMRDVVPKGGQHSQAVIDDKQQHKAGASPRGAGTAAA